MGFKDTNFYPENFVLLGNPNSQEAFPVPNSMELSV